MKLKTTMVISGARFLFYDLLNHYQFSDEDENRILRCCEDLSNCIKESDENVTQTDLRNIDDLQYPPRHDKTAYELQIENNRLREAIRLARDTAYQATQDCPRCGFIDDILTKALNGKSEGK